MADTDMSVATDTQVSPLVCRAATAVVYAFLLAVFLLGVGEFSPWVILGIAAVHAYAFIAYKYWSGLERTGTGDLVVAAVSAVFVIAALINWGSFSAYAWETFFGMAVVQGGILCVVQYWKTLRQAPPSAWFGLIVVMVYALLAILAPIVAPFGETSIVGSQYELWGAACTKVELCPPEAGAKQMILGTDHLGRDMLSRLIYGARNTIGLAFLTTILAFSLGGVMGLLAASLGGWVDNLTSRVVDILMAIPSLVFSLLILTVVGTSYVSIVLVIAVLDSTRVYRLARAVAMNIVVMDYVEVAKLRGEGLWYIIRHELLPNAMPPLVAEFGLRFCFVFLFISALSFLGLGLQPPTADWGSMVKENATLITFEDVTPLVPAGAIALLTVGVNFVVDWFLHKTSGLKS